MKYEKGFVFDLMEQGGPNDVREPYFKRFLKLKVMNDNMIARSE